MGSRDPWDTVYVPWRRVSGERSHGERLTEAMARWVDGGNEESGLSNEQRAATFVDQVDARSAEDREPKREKKGGLSSGSMQAEREVSARKESTTRAGFDREGLPRLDPLRPTG